jgi:hypothetical protein
VRVLVWRVSRERIFRLFQKSNWRPSVGELWVLNFSATQEKGSMSCQEQMRWSCVPTKKTLEHKRFQVSKIREYLLLSLAFAVTKSTQVRLQPMGIIISSTGFTGNRVTKNKSPVGS